MDTKLLINGQELLLLLLLKTSKLYKASKEPVTTHFLQAGSPFLTGKGQSSEKNILLLFSLLKPWEHEGSLLNRLRASELQLALWS